MHVFLLTHTLCHTNFQYQYLFKGDELIGSRNSRGSSSMLTATRITDEEWQRYMDELLWISAEEHQLPPTAKQHDDIAQRDKDGTISWQMSEVPNNWE